MAIIEPLSHDQNFKNLILDYPCQALQFFAPQEATGIDENTIITPIRQEQLKNRLGDRFHELDVPLKVEWPDKRRAALLFLLEEESDPKRFSIHRLGRYCLELSELMDTTRVVPVVIFLRSSPTIARELHLGGDSLTFQSLRYIACVLPDISAQEHKDSNNIVARITLPTMRYARQQAVDVFAWAVQGLRTLGRVINYFPPRCPVMRMDTRSVAQPILKYWQAARRSRRRITGQPVGTGTGAAHCGVAARLCSMATRHSPRLALHRPCTRRGGK